MKNLILIGLLLVGATIPVQADPGFLQKLIGDLPVANFPIYLIWAYLGIILNVVSDLLRRKKSSPSSPQKLDSAYWWSDNYRRLILSCIVAPIFIVFFSDIMGMELTRFTSLFIGLSSDHLLEILKRKDVIGNVGKR